MQALEIIINGKELTIINIYGPNNDDVSLFNKLEDYIKENEDKNFLLGGEFNTVLDTNTDKHNGKNDTHKRCRTKINHIIDTYNLIDIWREKHFDLREYTWHSSHRPPIFCRLDYFLVSENVRNFVISCKHNISYKSDHCPGSITLHLSQHFEVQVILR